MTPRRLALLGFGHVAEHGHLPAWRAREDFTVVAVADPDPARRAAAARLLPDARVFDDATALLAADRYDAVDVAAPPVLHAPLAIAAAAAGCHILCEKPLAVSPADYRALVAAVRRAGVTLCTVHNWKQSAQFIELRRLLAAGAVGQPTQLALETVRDGHAASVGGAWRASAALAGGGIFVDHGWHALYLLLALAGEAPRRIAATFERRRCLDGDVEDTAACRIEFATLNGEIFLTWAGSERRTRWQATGSGGTVTLADARGELIGAGTRRAWTFPRSLSAGSHHPEWFGGVIDEFVAEIEDPARRGINLAEAERCVRLIALAYRSGARGGAWLDVPPARRATAPRMPAPVPIRPHPGGDPTPPVA